MNWLVELSRAAVAGSALGLVAVALQLARRLTGRLDLVPVLAGSAVALITARSGGTDQVDRVVEGLLLVPLAGLAGAIVNLAVAGRPRSGSPATRAVLVPVAVFVIGRSALERWGDDEAPLAVTRAGGIRLADRLIVSWADLAVAAASLAVAGLVALGIWRGRMGLRIRAAQEAPELVALVGVEPSRLEAALAGVGAALGALGGLLLGVTATDPAPDAADLAVRAGESLLIGGGFQLWRALGGAVALELTRAAGDQVAEGWGPACGHALALAVVAGRWIRGVRSRDDDEPANEELIV